MRNAVVTAGSSVRDGDAAGRARALGPDVVTGRARRRARWLIPVVLVLAPVAAAGQQSDSTVLTSVPRILSPAMDSRVPRRDVDPPCPEAGPCPRAVVRGQVPAGMWPFLAVTPLAAAPRTWIQPPILVVQRNGMFDGLVYLGVDDEGRGERFTIVVLGCRDRQRFREGAVITDMPGDCMVSDPVTVVRTR